MQAYGGAQSTIGTMHNGLQAHSPTRHTRMHLLRRNDEAWRVETLQNRPGCVQPCMLACSLHPPLWIGKIGSNQEFHAELRSKWRLMTAAAVSGHIGAWLELFDTLTNNPLSLHHFNPSVESSRADDNLHHCVAGNSALPNETVAYYKETVEDLYGLWRSFCSCRPPGW